MSAVRRTAALAAAALLLSVGLVAVESPASAALPGTITGVVTRANGMPLADAMVGIWTPGEEAYEDFVDTDSTGTFTFSFVPPDDYLVYVYGTSTEPGIYWPDAPTEHTATLVPLTLGGSATANFTLTKGATISGRLINGQGAGVGGADVETYLQYGACASCWELVGDGPWTGAKGYWTARNLNPGTYRIGFAHSDYLHRYFTGSTSFADATTITVTAGQTRSGVNVTIRKGVLAVHGTGSVAGLRKVGRTLAATAPTSTPRAVTTYRWLRAGKPITGATYRTYRVRSADKGKRVSVRVTLRRNGYVTVVRTIQAGRIL